jgi:hypothetical protein
MLMFASFTLRVPRDAASKAKQLEQTRALLRWSMRHLASNPNANLVVLGDFNEGRPVGSPEQSLAVLFQARPPMVDSFSFLQGRARTHHDGRAYDRILVSDGIVRGLANRLDRFFSLAVEKPHWSRLVTSNAVTVKKHGRKSRLTTKNRL